MPSWCLNLRVVAYVMIGWTGRVVFFSACFSVQVVCSTMYQVSVKCHVGALASGLETITTSFAGRNLCFRPVFCYFRVLFILPKF